ncbi:ABC transporter [Pseudoalteromonas rubra]|uniref:ABC transporter n=1 Tax=Pseudoalteromonas rubra TaxID=43658 RepID=A0A5S3WS48_9GAMM|nr:ATP-binding cassette domain-containing protein [Pseudoalteromonas rubra]TMP30125.1 ABC transporter [Pseudoalteromonas rubra]TMP32008.1 ABC transporter [Pseudoalteromonas rubra]
MIQVEGLKKRFKLSREHNKNKTGDDPRERDGYFHSVESVSFQCQKGEVLGLLGPNGAGKTTTLRLLSTALSPDSGAIIVAGQDIVKNPLHGRRHIGFLSGTTGLYGRLSAKENVEYFARLHGLRGKELKARCELLFETLDMTSFLDKRSDSLSTGMKQKTSIARAVVHDPQVVILDEPTTGLDIMTKQTLLSFIRQLKEQGTPVIFSTHHLDEIDMLCDRVCVIDKGISCFEGSLTAFREQGQNGELNQAFLTIIQGEQYV